MRSAWAVLCCTFLAVIAVAALAAAPAHARSITALDKDEPSTLELKDGRRVVGRYRSMLGSPRESADYAGRYEAWRTRLGAEPAPALGESLIVFRGSAEPARGTFRGFADRAILLGTADSCVHLVVPLDKHVAVRRTVAASTEPDWLATRGRWKSAPSLYAFALRSDEGTTFAVPTTLVAQRHKLPPTTGQRLGGLLLGAVVFTTLICLAGMTAMAASFNNQPLI
jgi:hypothetical protein